MIAEVTILRSRWLRAWPCFVAAFCSLPLGILLARWFPFHFAIGIATFLSWTFAGVVLARREPPKWGLPRWLAVILMGVAPGLTVGLLWFFFP